ncbi:MAG: hypothetical protein A2X42_12130 [Candidatus Margulisbacteria bacterium GWF2_38_17]|nr:MAG: hypothetical protein A2X43_06235 [Candidatus Margulisbacteria bacterium GWD2_39_127]OGI01755.1 MAG: hypothetical protein A2X42_12130 [Candidatus Margulisbacteria bacterium GWF2_38_17]OGI10680.1 MAG: hypothetical protein A2X41_10165 [Candidatus Margulisbacteria bacterium GWE2_39_32]
MIAANVTLAMLFIVVVPGMTIDTSKSLDGAQDAFIKISKEATPAVVNISTTRVVKNEEAQESLREFFGDDFLRKFFEAPRGDYKQTSLGSGVIVDSRGYILTNNHVIEGATSIVVRLNDAREFKGKVIGVDTKTDLAVIKIEAKNLTVVRFGDSDKIEVGQWAIAIGSPFGFTQTVTVGIISAKGRSRIGLVDYEDFMQTDAAINPGNSGGALLNINGELVGINTAIFSRTGGYEGIGFAIPSNMAKIVMDDLIRYGKITRGWLGVYIQQIDEKLARQLGVKTSEGVLVVEVSPGSPAEKAGVKRRDVITSYDGKKVTDPAELRNMVATSKVGQNVKLNIIRNGKEMEITAHIELLQEGKAAQKSSPPAQFNKLGLKVQPLTQDLADKLGYKGLKGVLVSDIEAGSLSDEVGLKPGDLIMEVNQQEVTNTNDFDKAIADIKKGDRLLLLIRREGFSYYVVIEIN